MIRVGIGQSDGIETKEVIKKVLDQCSLQLAMLQPQAGIVFAGPNFDHQLMLDCIHDAYPNIALIGCTTAGDFSSAHGFSDDSISLLALFSDEIEFGIGMGNGLSTDFRRAVSQAATMARESMRGEPNFCFTFPRGLNKSFGQALGFLGEQLGPDCPIFGGAAATLLSESEQIHQFFGREVFEDSIPLLLLSGPIEYEFSIAKSWRPVGTRAVVGEASDNTVMTIGESSAVDFYRHYLGYHTDPAMEFLLAVYEPGSDDYYVCAPLQYLEDGAILFSGPVPSGAEVQLTEATREDLLSDTVATSTDLTMMPREWEPSFALTFSCALRKEILGTTAQKELGILKEAFPANLPIMGFYSFGEISPLLTGGISKVQSAALIMLFLGPGNGEAAYRSQSVGLEKDRGVREERCENISFLQRKLKRSEAYRRRLESVKDSHSKLHRQIMKEMNAARCELKSREAELRKSEEKYRRIVQTAGEGFILMDENLRIIDANEAYCRMVDYSQDEVIGKSNLDLASDEFQQYLIANRERLLAQEYRRFEGTLVHKRGRHIPVLIHGNTLRDDKGDLLGHMAFITDLTEQKKALELAGEVQRSLLPKENPKVHGLDIAGRNLSCDEVGGDYFDFFLQRENSRNAFSVAVGDITGHGVDAALLMSSARAMLRMHVSQEESITQIVDAMNNHLVEDVEKTGRFMTLFYMSVHSDLASLEWIRAGHDPAIYYDPSTETFDYLKGPGIALGVTPDYSYVVNRRSDLRHGSVIAIGTDGIWETTSIDGEMFGRKRFLDLLRQYAHLPAADILGAVFSTLENFRRGRKANDDITLVIVKIAKKDD